MGFNSAFKGLMYINLRSVKTQNTTMWKNPAGKTCNLYTFTGFPCWNFSHCSILYIYIYKSSYQLLTLILPTWRIWWASNNASRWQMGSNVALKVLISLLIAEVPRSKAWVCSRSLVGFEGSNPVGAWMSVCCECCVVSGIGLYFVLITRPEKCYRVWCVWVWPWSLLNEEALAHQELLRCGKGILN